MQVYIHANQSSVPNNATWVATHAAHATHATHAAHGLGCLPPNVFFYFFNCKSLGTYMEHLTACCFSLAHQMAHPSLNKLKMVCFGFQC